MPDFTPEQFFNPSEEMRDFLDIPQRAVQGFCAIAQQNPWLTSRLGRQLQRRWCRPPNVPPSPEQPPTIGGQCCADYRVVINYVDATGAAKVSDSVRKGKVRIRHDVTPKANGFYDSYIILSSGNECPGVSRVETTVAGQQNGQGTVRPFITGYTITRTDNQPDTCGNFFPPPILPPTPVPPVFNFNIPITTYNRNYNIPVTIPIIQTDINFNLRPEFTLELPDFNLTFNFDGMTVTAPTGGREPNQPPYRLPPVPDDRLPLPPNRPPIREPIQPDAPGRPTGGTRCPDLDLRPVLEAVANVQDVVDVIDDNVELLLDCDRCDRRPPEDCTKGLFGTGQSLTVPINKTVQWVGIELTAIPINAKKQFGVVAPDVFYAGWYSFGGNGCEGHRQPIHYRNNVFPAVEGSSRFSFTLPSGYVANCFLYTIGGEA